MTVVALEVDPPLRLAGVVLDPTTSPERIAAFADYLRHDLPDFDAWLADLRARLGGLVPATIRPAHDTASFHAALADAEVAVIEALRLGPAELDAVPHLRVVQQFGLDDRNIDLDACAARGVVVRTQRRRTNIAVAEHSIALLMALAKRLDTIGNVVTDAGLTAHGFHPTRYDTRHTAAANWGRVSGLRLLSGATLGLIGFGEIGREVARIAGGIGMHVLVHQRTPIAPAEQARLGIATASLAQTLAQSDAISVHVPGSQKDLTDAAAIARVKPGALLINTACAQVVNRCAADGGAADGTSRRRRVRHALCRADAAGRSAARLPEHSVHPASGRRCPPERPAGHGGDADRHRHRARPHLREINMDKLAARTVPALLAEMATRFPDRPFAIDERRALTYAAFQAEARRLAKSLYSLGVRRHDKVALVMGNQVEWLLLLFAVTMLGGVLVAVNTWWRRRELEHALRISDSSTLIMVDRYISNDYTQALAELGDLATALPMLQRIVCLGETLPPGAVPYAEMLALGGDVADAVIDDATAAIDPEDLTELLFTSGSTARAKAAGLAHRGLIDNMHGIGERMHLTEQDRLLLVVSMFWSYACANGLFAAMTHGAAVVLQFRYDAGEMLRLVDVQRCTAVYTQPNMVLELYAHPDRRIRDLSSWRTGIGRPQVMDALAEIGPQEMITSYGLTECYGNSCNSDAKWPLSLRKRGSGHPLPGVELRIADPATGAEWPPGQDGEIWLRGNVTPGYHNDPERTCESIDVAGWFHTGDVGLIDEQGIVVYRGRFKEMIKTGGINVTPADVEELLQEHPAVPQAIVVGVPDRERDEIVAAMVVLKPGAQATPAELDAHCRAAAAQFKVPRFIEIVPPERVPLTDTGKVAKRAVIEALTAARAATVSA